MPKNANFAPFTPPIMNQIKAGVLLNFVIIGLNTITGLLYTPYMMGCLGQNEYGLYSLVASLIAYISILDAGFGSAVVRFTARYRVSATEKEQSELIGMSLIINSVLSIIAVIAGIVLYMNIDSLFDRTMTATDLSQARTMMVFLIINLAFSFPLGVFTSIITAYERFIFQKSLNAIRIILLTLTIVALLFLGYKAIAIVVAQTAFNLAVLLANLIFCRRRLHIRISFRNLSFPLFKELSLYSLWVFLDAIISRIYWSTGQFILGMVSGTIAVAVYSAAITLNQMYQLFSGAISGVLLPRLSKLAAAPDSSPREISDLFIRAGRLQAILILFIVSGFIVFGKGFIALWAGPAYATTFYVALIFFIAQIPSQIQSTGIYILQARNRMRFRILTYLAVSTLSIIGQYYLGRAYGPVGAATAIGIALIVGTGLIINIYYARCQQIDIASFWRQILSMSPVPCMMTIIGVVIGLLVDLTTPLHFIIGLTLFIAIYIPLFWRLSLTPADRTSLRSLLPKRHS